LVTFTNATAGAAIFYSTEPGIFPAPQVTRATLYSSPFTVPSGTDLRWAGYQDGLAGSNAGFQTINY
jgi:hypothetical protein